MSSEGISRLANVIHRRVSDMGKASFGDLLLDFGTILSDYKLLTNTYPNPIPKEDYLVLRQLTLGNTGDILAKTQEIGKPHSGSHIHKTINLTCPDGNVSGTVGEATGAAPDPPNPPESSAGGDSSDGQHQHHVLIPEKMRWLKPGDRVLVAWVQHDAVVIDIIRPATDIG